MVFNSGVIYIQILCTHFRIAPAPHATGAFKHRNIPSKYQCITCKHSCITDKTNKQTNDPKQQLKYTHSSDVKLYVSTTSSVCGTLRIFQKSRFMIFQ